MSGNDAMTHEAMPYEAARDELLDVVRQLETGGLPLEQSLALWERGEQLAVSCQAWLDGARERLAARRPDTSLDIETARDDEGNNG
jgi:exodeoxyribonuclease VII small subunit